MEKQEAIDIIDKMISQIPDLSEDYNEIWVSVDIYNALEVAEYKGYKIYTSKIMPKKRYAISSKGSLYF